MTQSQYVIRRKLNILELGETLGNISEACRKLGVSRRHYYDIKSAVEEEGLEGLLEKSRKAPRVANRVHPEIEQRVLDYSLEYPTQGQMRVANELKKQGIQISDGGVRSIWLRHNLQLSSLRLKRLEKWAAAFQVIRHIPPRFNTNPQTCFGGGNSGLTAIAAEIAGDCHALFFSVLTMNECPGLICAQEKAIMLCKVFYCFRLPVCFDVARSCHQHFSVSRNLAYDEIRRL